MFFVTTADLGGGGLPGGLPDIGAMLQKVFDDAMKELFQMMIDTYAIPDDQFAFMTKRGKLGEGSVARASGVSGPR